MPEGETKMSVYIVRWKKTKEFVGFFWVERFEDLFEKIDECCNPLETEFIRSANGGVFWQKSINWIAEDTFEHTKDMSENDANRYFDKWDDERIDAGAPDISELIYNDLSKKWRSFEVTPERAFFSAILN